MVVSFSGVFKRFVILLTAIQVYEDISVLKALGKISVDSVKDSPDSFWKTMLRKYKELLRTSGADKLLPYQVRTGSGIPNAVQVKLLG